MELGSDISQLFIINLQENQRTFDLRRDSRTGNKNYRNGTEKNQIRNKNNAKQLKEAAPTCSLL